jgi:hypothetical protein
VRLDKELVSVIVANAVVVDDDEPDDPPKDPHPTLRINPAPANRLKARRTRNCLNRKCIITLPPKREFCVHEQIAAGPLLPRFLKLSTSIDLSPHPEQLSFQLATRKKALPFTLCQRLRRVGPGLSNSCLEFRQLEASF